METEDNKGLFHFFSLSKDPRFFSIISCFKILWAGRIEVKVDLVLNIEFNKCKKMNKRNGFYCRNVTGNKNGIGNTIFRG